PSGAARADPSGRRPRDRRPHRDDRRVRMTAPIVTVGGGATDVGARRKLNEDAYLAAAPLFIVADGMGGHDAGEVASATVIQHFSRLVGAESLSIEQMR